MKRSLITLTIALTTLFASAQTDSISMSKKTHELQEVVVKSDVALTSAEKSTYLPTRKQRNAATDAVALLQHMMIPQLSINPMTEAVRTIANEEVSIFIDFLPATTEDLQGMNTQDVKRVEIYDFPKDVRFQNKPHVVNFVMQRYEIGGYTKLSSTEMVLADFASVNSVYSKLAHKNWTFDANLSGRFTNRDHMGAESNETYCLPTQEITRTEFSENGKFRNIESSASLRATYQANKMLLSNRLELLDNNTRKNDALGTVSYLPAFFAQTNSISRRSSHSITPTYQGDWQFFLPNEWSLNISPKYQFIHISQSRFYQENTPIQNEIEENGSQTDWQLYLGKTFAKMHTLRVGTAGMFYSTKIDYTGSTQAIQKMNMLSIDIPVFYTYRTQRLTLSAQAFACYLRYNVNGEKTKRWTPVIRTTVNYAFNQKNRLQANYYHMYSLANGAQRNESLMQQNPLMFYCGNSDLKNYAYNIGQIQYTWMPSNKFTAAAYLQHVFVDDYFANVWQTTDDGQAILRQIQNVGDAHETNIGASLTLRLLDGKLQLSAKPELNILRVSGRYDEKENPFSINLAASYYLKVGSINS